MEFGTRAVALVLALGCLLYAGVCSLGFVAGSTDKAVSERVIAGDAYADRRALVKAARDELATLKGRSRAVMERRRELATILAPKTPETRAKPVQQDAQAAALAFYIRAAGWPVTDEAVRIWLALGLVVFLEMAAALSLTVAVALRPARGETRLEAPPAAENSPGADVPAKPETAASEPVRPASRPSADNGRQDSDDDTPPPPKPPRRPGRPATVLAPQAVERLRKAGGSANGSVRTVGKLLGAKSKTTAHRLLHRLRDSGLILLDAGPNGVHVALA